MKPIDTIRKKIDPDLLKYHGSILCEIAKVKDMKGIGMVAMVRPLTGYDSHQSLSIKNTAAAGAVGVGGVGATKKAAVSGPVAAGAQLGKVIAKQFYTSKEQMFPVVIANRVPGEVEKDIIKKYYVFVISPVKDRISMAVGLLVPNSAMSKAAGFIDSTINNEEAMKTQLGDSTNGVTVNLVSAGV